MKAASPTRVTTTTMGQHHGASQCATLSATLVPDSSGEFGSVRMGSIPCTVHDGFARQYITRPLIAPRTHPCAL
jgi:hypothetical protein